MSATVTISQSLVQIRAQSDDLELRSTHDDTEFNRVYMPVYSKFSNAQKRSITAFLAFCGVLATTSTTSILTAIPEIVETFHTNATVISVSNAVYLLFMGFSVCFWGPWADIFGRKSAYVGSTGLFFFSSLGTALAPSLPLFFVFRALTACQGSAFLVLGSSCISDIYHPTERATSLGWFLTGVMVGPAFGPVLGGIIVTFTSWRVIFWLQMSFGGLAALMAIFLLHETIQQPRFAELKGHKRRDIAVTLWKWTNPVGLLKLWGQKNLFCVSLASAALVWNMYSLLTPIRIVLNPRLNLTSPLESAMLYIAPGTGYVVGTLIGGRWADWVVRYWMRKRGVRIPEDRLRSSLLFLGIILPGSMLLYGWTVDQRIGSIPLPVICMFFQGVAQLAAFPSLNTYILDVMQHRSGQASASHYLMRYLFAGSATASCLPMIDSIGVGWTSTISSVMVFLCAGLVALTISAGKRWREGDTPSTRIDGSESTS
ncbi:hypothetical protein FDECE_2580 [Fusarium decemcellulare]|nr:hypothetical protein FDECE_2580 [Fusarium decemcellulare]